MSFTARVKKTGQIFDAVDELDDNGNRVFDAHRLESGRKYGGYLYEVQATNDPSVFAYTRDRTKAAFDAEEIEQLRPPVKLKDRRPT